MASEQVNCSIDKPPRRRYTLFLLLLAATVSLAIAAITTRSRDREPSYEGVSLTTWLQRYCADEGSAEHAIRAIGTNAVPFLRNLVRSQDSVLRKRLSQALLWLDASEFDINSALQKQFLACAGFRALGTTGVSAIPDLWVLVGNTNTSGVASLALAGMGSNGVQVLSQSLTNRDPAIRCAIATALGKTSGDQTAAAGILAKTTKDAHHAVRWAAVRALGSMEAHSALAVTVLSDTANDTNRIVRRAALEALGNLGGLARSAEGVIRGATNDPDPFVRKTAIEALAKCGLAK